MLSNRGRKHKGYDGFSVLFLGVYKGKILEDVGLVLFKSNVEKAYLPPIKIQEKMNFGDITFYRFINSKILSYFSMRIYKEAYV